jgi:lactate permease
VAGATFTMLSPTRIATGCALLGLVGQDRAAYARVWPFAAAALSILLTCWVALP